MAIKTVTFKIDDLDGGDADETVYFALDGRLYKIDLSKDNADNLREAMAPFVNAATSEGKVAAPSNGGSTRQRVTRVESDAKAVRAWADANGLEVAGKGRISREIRQQYEAAQG